MSPLANFDFLFCEDDDDEMRMLESLEFNFSTLKIATDKFSNDNKLGQGGFGSVYKVTFL